MTALAFVMFKRTETRTVRSRPPWDRPNPDRYPAYVGMWSTARAVGLFSPIKLTIGVKQGTELEQKSETNPTFTPKGALFNNDLYKICSDNNLY